GTPALATPSFIHAFDPSSRAPSAPGPSTSRPAARSSSARPATSGASGPMTYRSASTSVGGVPTDPGMPGLPGVTTTSALRPSTWASACSRPPDPTTQTRMVTPRLVASRRALDELLAARPHPDEADGHAHLLLEDVEVVAVLRRQVGRLGGPGQVGPPAGELLVDRPDLVQQRLVVGEPVEPAALGLVGDADPHGVEGIEHVELGDRHLGQRVEPHRVPEHDGVEPPGPAAPARVRPGLVPPLDERVAGLVEQLGRERPRPHPGDVGLGHADHP